MDLLGACSYLDLAVLRREFHGVCQQVHQDLLETALVSNDAVLDEAVVVMCDLDATTHALRLNELNNLVEDRVHGEVVIFNLYLAVFQQRQIEHIPHLELYNMSGGLDVLQKIQLLLRRDVCSRHYEVDEDRYAREGRHQIVADGRLQHLQHLVVVSLLV